MRERERERESTLNRINLLNLSNWKDSYNGMSSVVIRLNEVDGMKLQTCVMMLFN